MNDRNAKSWIQPLRAWWPRSPLEQTITGTAALLATVALVAGWALWQQNLADIEAAERNRVEAVAASAALHIDGQAHERWARAFQKQDSLLEWSDAPADLQEVRALLVRTHRAAKLSTPAYTLRLRNEFRHEVHDHPDRELPDAMEFLITTANQPYWRHRYKYRPEMAATLLHGRVASTSAYQEENRLWISSYAPVRDETGRIHAILEVDSPVESPLIMAKSQASGLLILVLLCFLGSLSLGVVLLAIMRARDIEASRLALVSRSTDHGVVITDSQGRIEWVNPGFVRMTGLSSEGTRGHSPASVFGRLGADPDVVEALRSNFSTPHQSKLEVALPGDAADPDSDGALKTLELEVQPVHDGADRLRHFVAVLRDLTRTKRTEDMMIRARDEALQASRLKSEFLANVSHELRTPLNGILGVQELLLSSELDQGQLDLVQTAQRCGHSLLDMINEILDFAQIESGLAELRRIDFDLRDLVHELTKETRARVRGRNVHVTSRVAPELPSWLSGDAIRLRQVISELAVNAAKFTEEGLIEIQVDGTPIETSAVRLSKRPEQSGRDSQASERAARTNPADFQSADTSSYLVRFEVRDTGCGIPSDKLGSIFDSFIQIDGSSTREAGGTGLGLTVGQRNVELMGGRIGVRSEEGQGSTLWFAIPLERAGERSDEMLFDLSA